MRTSVHAAVFVRLALSAPAAAQTRITTGGIQGLVADATGSVLPGTTVEARHVATNLTRSTTTDASGRFVLLQLPPGRYNVTYTLSGFATLVQENVELAVGQAVTLDAQLKVSGVAEAVTVSSAPSWSGPGRRRRARSTRRPWPRRPSWDASSRNC